jgi:hypothetical protein
VGFGHGVLENLAQPDRALEFAVYCIRHDDALGLMLFLQMHPPPPPRLSQSNVARLCAKYTAHQCLDFVLPLGAPWIGNDLVHAVVQNCIETLDVVVRHRHEVAHTVMVAATCLARVRFWMRLHYLHIPTWNVVSDSEPSDISWTYCLEAFSSINNAPPSVIGELTLVVSSDLVCSGPLLLYAAERGVDLTARMTAMLREVRHRALALTGCFHVARRLSQAPGAAARNWSAMGRVNADQRIIATLARISIAQRDLVE